ncbi:peptidoglycan-binding domain-containing protein [Micavibrio aeruginosavorus]|uniref:Peptidoglycan binding-like domain-containing protein n=1 Tax=Micavibrio aeruginosavorus EPB TaxID=349215 RepID=M4W0P6_9BACT|nr:hypothetical protein [Micavibrio aeruginosavorus]AGH98989.1 hypothetical protein A11S_2193 [Micavibrio aeruginosavorus EPB]
MAGPNQQDQDFNVGEAQGLMRMMGFDTGPVDNDLGPKTTAALDAYRAQNNIPDTASMNDVMVHMREQAQTDPKVIANMASALRDGANGQMDVNDARAIQHVLNAHGADLKVDGIVGPLTEGALLDQVGLLTPSPDIEPQQQVASAAPAASASSYDLPPAAPPPPVVDAGGSYDIPVESTPPMVDVTNVAPAVSAMPAEPAMNDGVFAADPAPAAPAMSQDSVRNYERGSASPSFNHSASHGGAYDNGVRVRGPGYDMNSNGGFRINTPQGGISNSGFRVNIGGVRLNMRF